MKRSNLILLYKRCYLNYYIYYIYINWNKKIIKSKLRHRVIEPGSAVWQSGEVTIKPRRLDIHDEQFLEYL